MLHPAPTTKIDPNTARGQLIEVIPATATRPAFLVVHFFNSDYKCHLEPAGGTLPTGVEGKVGRTVTGTIRASAKRVDRVSSGGKLIDPVFGRPRRVQGRIVAMDAAKNTITVSAGAPFVCTVTAPGQKAGDFEAGDFVSFDVLRGATIELA